VADNWEIVQDAILAFNMHVPDMAVCREKLFLLLSSEAWSDYSPPIGEECKPSSFAEWVSAKVPRGLDTTVKNLQDIAQGDENLRVLLDKTIQEKHGGDRRSGDFKFNNIQLETPVGTSELAGRRRLRKDRPDLDALVDSGQLSTHAAMVQAGFRPKTFTVRADRPESIVGTLRRQLAPETLALVIKLLSEEN